jgi:hypothetical protein
MPVYEFPTDYIERLRSAIAETDSVLGAVNGTREKERERQKP